MEKRRVMVLDAFTDTPFNGNPCGIIPDANGLSSEMMQKIAKEINLSETSFVMKSEVADFRVHYFTPRYELGFAGHPTIATAFMLAQEGYIDLSQPTHTINLEFNIGVLPVEILAENGKPLQAVMTQSAPSFGDAVSREDLADSFKRFTASDFVDESQPQVTGTGSNFLIAGIKDIKKLETIEMNRENLCQIVDKVGVAAAYIFALDDKTGITQGRLMDPRGTFEDPFTGAAVGATGAYIIQNGLSQRSEFSVEQGKFVGRPGYGKLLVQHNGIEITSVKLGGTAVTVTDGMISIPES